MIVGHIGDDVKSGRTIFIQLDIDISGRLDIIALDILQIKSESFQLVQNFFTGTVPSDSRNEADIKAEIFKMIGKVKGSAAKAPVIWEHIKHYLSNYQNHLCSLVCR